MHGVDRSGPHSLQGRPIAPRWFACAAFAIHCEATRLRILAAQFARALPRHSTLKAKRAQGRPGADLAPTVRCAKGSAKEPHSSIQVVPITRPSLRDGRTAYAALSREPSSLWPPSPSRNSPAPRRLTRSPPPQELDRSNDGQDHTVLPYARPAMFAIGFDDVVHVAANPRRDGPVSAVRPHEAWGSRRAIRPAPDHSRPTLPRPPQARLAKTTTS
ncbi:hypothetical protein FBZ96_105578 [Bradyrhizobium stylosanthis]|uniref:Uncharacterized protein n=1 Tax=Bradyrhizobium stylosanthis TaxID=1803665 RepID=A0A560DP85_9BRAD|nr:hypothetical protein FBZ96_105578 [Bradyrhizobium stylosanthis]